MVALSCCSITAGQWCSQAFNHTYDSSRRIFRELFQSNYYTMWIVSFIFLFCACWNRCFWKISGFIPLLWNWLSRDFLYILTLNRTKNVIFGKFNFFVATDLQSRIPRPFLLFSFLKNGYLKATFPLTPFLIKP